MSTAARRSASDSAPCAGGSLPKLYRGRRWFGLGPFLRYGIPRFLLYFEGGLGDEFLCATVLHELRARGGRGLWMMSDHAELFFGNNDIDAVIPVARRHRHVAKRIGAQVVFPIYAAFDRATDRQEPPTRHILSCMCRAAGITGRIALRPYLSLSAAERVTGRLAPRQIVIQSTGLSAKYPMLNKEWGAGRFQSVVDRLGDKYSFIQVGACGDPLLRGATDLRGKTSVRELAAILSHALVFVGLVGFIMHLARAVECRAVIVYGGRETPEQTGYSANVNLSTAPDCSPCWQWNRCDHDRQCMDLIRVEDVVAAIEAQAARFGSELPVDIEDIPGPAST